MKVLGIESSCDETALAVVSDHFEVLSSLVTSQIELHKPFGGVVPEIAARSHLLALPALLKTLEDELAQKSTALSEIDAIAVTSGPGLVGALLVGACFGKGLSLSLQKPLIPVNHVHAHVAGALLGLKTEDVMSSFPALAIVVTGGHTHLYYMPDQTTFLLVGHGIDDACGESFDKVAKLMGYGYPGGPVIEKLAKNGDPKSIPMPVMVPGSQNMNFSYSGLKTAVSLALKKEPQPYSDQFKANISASFQNEALNQLIRKLKNAVTMYPAVKTLIIAGGVAANSEFRTKISENFKLRLILPQLKYCSDNGAMIAALGSMMFEKKLNFPEWDVFASYPYQKAQRAPASTT